MAVGARDPRLGSTARWVVRGVIVALIAWLVVSAVVVWTARRHTDDGLDALERARAAIADGGLVRGAANRELRTAKEAFAEAGVVTGGPVLAAWGLVPFLGGNADSVASLTSAAEHVAEVALHVADRTRELLGQHPATGPERLTLLRDLAGVTRRAERSLRSLDLGADFLLAASLGDARERFVASTEQLRRSLASATAAAEGVERLLRGPRRYLVLVASNAEMRGGSGMMLSAGVATFEGGSWSLDELRPPPEFDLSSGAVTLPEDVRRLWGFTPAGRDWRWLGTTPRFDVTAPLAADMWRQKTGERLDGVIAIDPVAVRALLGAQGPIEVGRRLSKDDVVDYLLLEQYGLADASSREEVARHDQVSAVVRGALDAMLTRVWNPEALVHRLGDAGRGRHVLVWSRHELEERAWTTAGVGGELRFDSLAVSILNTSGTKLDPFLRVRARLRVTERADGGHDATLTLRLRNDVPKGLPTYVTGPHPNTSLAAGEYQGIVAVNSPGVGSLPRIEGLPTLLVAGRDGPTKVAAAGPLRVAPGEAATVTVRVVLPAALERIVVEPSARVPPIQWRYRGERWSDANPHPLDVG